MRRATTVASILGLALAAVGTSDAIVTRHDRDEARFIRILAWSSFTAARRFAWNVAGRAAQGRAPQIRAVAA